LTNGLEVKRKEEADEDLSEFLFELSNYDRLRLLSLLESDEINLSTLAKKSSNSVQETSRHLERLLKSSLIDRKSSGEYFASSVGQICLRQLDTLEFVVRNRDYLFEHDLSVLPVKFIHRLGELARANYARNVTDVLHHTEAVLKGARKYVFLMADQPLIPGFREDNALPALDEHVHWKSIIPRAEIPQIGSVTAPPRNFELRFLDKPKVAIALNEDFAGVTFSDMKGRLDMSAGFAGSDKIFHEWCLDLFFHYCDEAGLEPTITTNFEF